MSLPATRNDALLDWPGAEQMKYALKWMALVGVLFALVFGGADWVTAHRERKLHLFWPFERDIPLWPAWMVIYNSIYVLFLSAPWAVRTKESFRRLALSCVAIILISGIIFLLLPAELGFPPREVAGPFRALFRFSDKVNLDFNLLPSLHVGLGILCLHAYARERSIGMKLSAVAWGVALSASTVLTHQHHLPDILAAALLAGIIVLAAHKKGGQFTI